MKLNQIFSNAPEIEIEQLSIDSRLPMKNAIFFCLNGIKYDGHDYVDEAIDNGAIVIIYEKPIETKRNAIYVKVNSVNDSLRKIADVFYNYPNDGINEYVVSGCYGRSSVTNIMRHFLNKKSKCGYIGIFGINYNQTQLSLTFPALTSLDNLKMLSRMKKENIKNCVFESSPISLYYKKMDVLKPSVFIYTNTSIYSADYKVCDANYYSYIRRYLYTLEDHTCVLFNRDDKSFDELKDSINNYKTYGKDKDSDYRINNIVESTRSTKFEIIHDGITYSVISNLLCESHVYNYVAAVAALNINGYEIEDIIENLKDLSCIEGVFEPIDTNNNIIVDCAYNYDSIENILSFAKRNYSGKKIAIIGINYSDDDARLKKIIKLADDYLDLLYVTEDDSQEYAVIDILNRLDKYETKCNLVKCIRRSTAIELALEVLNKDDVLLILGKGSESYMNMGFGKQFYSGDKHFVVKYLNKRKDVENEII